jgi:hypothetical protein
MVILKIIYLFPFLDLTVYSSDGKEQKFTTENNSLKHFVWCNHNLPPKQSILLKVWDRFFL